MRLYRVSVEFEYMALADDAKSAESWATECARDLMLEDWADAQPYNGKLPIGWDERCCVYHFGNGDVRLPVAIAIHEEHREADFNRVATGLENV